MASRMANMWRSLANSRRFTTSTEPKMKAFTPTANDFLGRHHASKPRGDFVPVYVAVGLIALSVSFGLYTAKHELLYAPNVLVSKKKRETVPEVEDPDWAAAEADRFVRKSVFRRVAHLQDLDAVRAGISDPTRANDHPASYDGPKKVETLKSVGVDPGSH
ncbi:uncharacterized protein LOC103714554 isoform X2 [Phoenix dactylifera]|uniref:Uncharacterized protein LOC103714554 isoform X2 n=1 Tax=Phoenix dactylifera TaxID=42345 RepID=A0A8B7CIW3_PHODC|nr:uncharacterized protein LOC103714554 isoform X2 [Phoenix dactylifera]